MKKQMRTIVRSVGIDIALIICAAGLSTDPDHPNIVLIVSDDRGYHDLGSMDNTEIRTPNLDRLATEGVRLTNFYVTCPANDLLPTGRCSGRRRGIKPPGWGIGNGLTATAGRGCLT